MLRSFSSKVDILVISKPKEQLTVVFWLLSTHFYSYRAPAVPIYLVEFCTKCAIDGLFIYFNFVSFLNLSMPWMLRGYADLLSIETIFVEFQHRYIILNQCPLYEYEALGWYTSFLHNKLPLQIDDSFWSVVCLPFIACVRKIKVCFKKSDDCVWIW